MIALLRAEFRKLFTARSTYVIIFIALAIDVLIAGYAKGYKLAGPQLTDSFALQDSMLTSTMITAIFSALIALLLITHEYRYNTILYSLTSSNSRTKFLVAKFLAVTIFSLVLSTVIVALAPLLSTIGVAIAGNSLAPQSIYLADSLWRILFYSWGYSIIALLIGFLIRNQIGAIMTLFLFPSTIESLLTLLLKDNVSYLPFSALGSVMTQSDVLSYGKAALVFSIYLVVGWLIAWILFLKRDSN